jgi:uncharacterized protein YbjQ (UPF0145 family)
MRTPPRVTTTSSIEGWQVDSYLGVVAIHLVAGTGIGADFLAGFSDLFGGRSGAYQKQLASLYDEAIGLLHRKAEQLGGNWIVGLKVDIDEVSGKGVQMFMVTAMGTAVRASALTQQPTRGATQGRAVAAEVQRMERRLQVADEVRGQKLTLDERTWEFIVDQRVEAAAPAVLSWMVKAQDENSWQYVDASSKRRALAFFQNLPPPVATRFLHEALCEDARTAMAAIGIMRDLGLVSLEICLQALRSTNLDLRRRIVQVLVAHQQSYGEGDATLMSQLIRELPRAFPDGPDVIQGRGLLGGRKERWICEFCGHRNDLGLNRCGKCDRDTQGFLRTDITPEKAAAILAERRRALSALLEAGADPTGA